jgi:hypothetical protein
MPPLIFNSRKWISALIFVVVTVAAHSQQITAPPPSSPLNYTTNWIGNSLSGNNNDHVQLDIQNIYVGSDGSVYTNSNWDEGGLANSIYKNGQLISPNVSNGAGGPAITVANGLIFASQNTGAANNPPCAAGGCGVNVYNASTLQSAGSLSGDSRVASTGGSSNIYGIAAYNSQVYVAITDANVIDVFNDSSLALVRSISINNPARLAIDSSGGLWVSHKNLSALPNIDGNVYDIYGDFGLSTIDHYNNSGQHINTITLPDNGEVSALWIDSENNLYVGDQGQDQNIKIYNNILSNPTLSSTFGGQGGIYASKSRSDRTRTLPLHYRHWH